MNEPVHIHLKDCSEIKLSDADISALQAFNSGLQPFNRFWFKNASDLEEDAFTLLDYDPRRHKWFAGRFVGEAAFEHKGQRYQLTIQPRFGELFLFRMLEELYNIKLTPSANEQQISAPLHYVRKIMAFIWVHLLARANQHGVPRKNVLCYHTGYTLRGRIAVRPTMRSLVADGKLTSGCREKSFDPVIAAIILKAYQILLDSYGLRSITLPDNALEALHELYGHHTRSDNLNYHTYRRIVYKEVYRSFKPLVDFSWNIIAAKKMQQSQTDNVSRNGFSFFIDIAEIWELYLKSLLHRRLKPLGWQLVGSASLVYPDKFYRRLLIPDMMFEKSGRKLVFDAKYKRMYLFGQELDRDDFFQIHTYAGFHKQTANITLAGLLYPITTPRSLPVPHLQPAALFGNSSGDAHFFVDGLDMSLFQTGMPVADKIALLKQQEDAFADRVVNLLQRIG